MTPIEYSAGLGGWISLVLILLLIQKKPVDPLLLFLLPACVIGLTYAVFHLAWVGLLLLLFVLSSMAQPIILITVFVALLVSVTTYTMIDITNKFHQMSSLHKLDEDEVQSAEVES
jgi:apolipoprotein N-acyltransferase